MIASAKADEESPSIIEQMHLITSSQGDLRKRATEINRQLTRLGEGQGWKSGVRAHSKIW